MESGAVCAEDVTIRNAKTTRIMAHAALHIVKNGASIFRLGIGRFLMDIMTVCLLTGSTLMAITNRIIADGLT